MIILPRTYATVPKWNSKETTEIIDKIRTELYGLPANPDESRSELMGKALNYLKNF